jgi:phosphatidylglycerol---prolipoprotein diacylglyceryl transferase
MLTIDIDPVLVHLGPFAISWYGLAVGVAILVGVWLTNREAGRRGLPVDAVSDMMLWIALGGVVGARLLFVLDRWEYFAANPHHIIAIQTGGISIMGAILGGGLVAAILAWRQQLPIRRLFDAAAPGLILGQAIGRLGCLVTGDTLGKPTDGTWGIMYLNPGAHAPQLGVAYQPAFFYEQLWDLVVFAIIWQMRTRLKVDGWLFALYLGLYAIGKFAVTFVRLDPVYAWGLQQSHFVALGLMAIALGWFLWSRPNRRPARPLALSSR